MRSGPIQELQAAQRTASTRRQPRLVIAGATGVLGNEVLRRLVGLQQFESTQVLAREPITPALLAAALRLAPPGIHIAAPELVWRAARGDLRAVAGHWLQR